MKNEDHTREQDQLEEHSLPGTNQAGEGPRSSETTDQENRPGRTPEHQEHVEDANGEAKNNAERETPHERPSSAFGFSASIMVLRVRTQHAAMR